MLNNFKFFSKKIAAFKKKKNSGAGEQSVL